MADLEIVPNDEHWQPDNYKQPSQDVVEIPREHPHPLADDQLVKPIEENLHE